MALKYPDFICVGAARCGTTSLWKWLDQHPLVHMSPIKETNYFTRDLIGRKGPGDQEALTDIRFSDLKYISSVPTAVVQDELAYRAVLAGSEEQHCGEISPSYLFYAKQVAPRIYKFNPDCKIVILLREPLHRALSNHALFTVMGRETLSFNNAMKEEASRLKRGWEHGWAYRGLGLYCEAVEIYLNTFGEDKVWIGLYDDLLIDSQAIFDAICEFIGIPTKWINSGSKANQSPFSVGPILQFARTRPGRIVAQVIPEPLRRWLKFQDCRLKLTFEKVKTKEAKLLRTFYSKDIVKLTQLLPDLAIKSKWTY